VITPNDEELTLVFGRENWTRLNVECFHAKLRGHAPANLEALEERKIERFIRAERRDHPD
jgi:hypothetical protein